MCCKNKFKDNDMKKNLKEKKKLDKYLANREKTKKYELLVFKKNNFKSEIYILLAILWYLYFIYILILGNNITDISEKQREHKIISDIGKIILAFMPIVISIIHYNRSEKNKNNDERIKYNPIYLIETNRNIHTVEQQKINKKQIKIRVLFKEKTASIRNVKVYKYSNDYILKQINSLSLLSYCEIVCDSSINENIFIVADTINNERVYTLISGENVVHAIDSSNNVYPDFRYTKLYLQDPISKLKIHYMEKTIKELLYKNNFE